jgi:hypothetical protein
MKAPADSSLAFFSTFSRVAHVTLLTRVYRFNPSPSDTILTTPHHCRCRPPFYELNGKDRFLETKSCRLQILGATRAFERTSKGTTSFCVAPLAPFNVFLAETQKRLVLPLWTYFRALRGKHFHCNNGIFVKISFSELAMLLSEHKAQVLATAKV